jgi:ABC-type Fe3+/spermidine/putrescine transport system ATPase subunit
MTERNLDDFIRIRNITKRFGNVAAVDDADFGVAQAEFFSLLGPSGCGKTTLLRMIAGFEYPTEGAILIDGNDITDLPPHKRPSNMVFQSYAIFPHLNVFDNIAYGLRKQRLTRDELTRRVEEALSMIKLTGFGKRRGDQLSGGQRQRVALARALIMRPKVLLLDEPLGALDPMVRRDLQEDLRRIFEELSKTVLLVTHDLAEAAYLCDEVALMRDGHILQRGTMSALTGAPADPFVREFLEAQRPLDMDAWRAAV